MASQAQTAAADEIPAVDLQETEFVSRGCCCFFKFSCFRYENWERISMSDREQQHEIVGDRSWWGKGISTLMKVREWSELVAGPKWKTFIRRFNKSSACRSKTGKFHYDPLSYALNFDDGEGQNGQFVRDFSSRYAAIKVQNGGLLNGS